MPVTSDSMSKMSATESPQILKIKFQIPSWKLRRRKMNANSCSSNAKSSVLKAVSPTTKKEIGAIPICRIIVESI